MSAVLFALLVIGIGMMAYGCVRWPIIGSLVTLTVLSAAFLL